MSIGRLTIEEALNQADGVTVTLLDEDGIEINPLSDEFQDIAATDETVAEARDNVSDLTDDFNSVVSEIDGENKLLTDASLDAESVLLEFSGLDGNDITPSATSIDNADLTDANAIITHLSRSLQSAGDDEIRNRIFDSDGTPVDPASEDSIGDLQISVGDVESSVDTVDASVGQVETEVGNVAGALVSDGDREAVDVIISVEDELNSIFTEIDSISDDTLELTDISSALDDGEETLIEAVKAGGSLFGEVSDIVTEVSSVDTTLEDQVAGGSSLSEVDTTLGAIQTAIDGADGVTDAVESVDQTLTDDVSGGSTISELDQSIVDVDASIDSVDNLIDNLSDDLEERFRGVIEDISTVSVDDTETDLIENTGLDGTEVTSLVVLKVDINSDGLVYFNIGSVSVGDGFFLEPGQSRPLPIDLSENDLKLISDSGTSDVSVIARSPLAL